MLLLMIPNQINLLINTDTGMGMGMGMDTEPHKSTALILKKSFTILGGSVALILFFFNMLMF